MPRVYSGTLPSNTRQNGRGRRVWSISPRNEERNGAGVNDRRTMPHGRTRAIGADGGDEDDVQSTPRTTIQTTGKRISPDKRRGNERWQLRTMAEDVAIGSAVIYRMHAMISAPYVIIIRFMERERYGEESVKLDDMKRDNEAATPLPDIYATPNLPSTSVTCPPTFHYASGNQGLRDTPSHSGTG